MDEAEKEALEELEERLLKEAEKEEKKPMPVSGRSVFEVKRIKDKKITTDHIH